MGRLGLLLVAILGAFFAYQTMDAAFDYDNADAQEQADYLARSGHRLSRAPGFKSSMMVKTEDVTALAPARKVVITLVQPGRFVLNSRTRSSEMQRKCRVYNQSTLAENKVQTRVNYRSEQGRGLGSITLSPIACRRYSTDTQVAHR